jgi:GNAT superfamily N-acetyltransferase
MLTTVAETRFGYIGGPQTRVQAPEPEDLDILLAIQLEAYEEIYPNLAPEHIKAHTAELRQHLQQEMDEGKLLAAYTLDSRKAPTAELAGFASRRFDGQNIVITRLHVASQHQKKQIGSMLLKSCTFDFGQNNRIDPSRNGIAIEIPANCESAIDMANKYGARSNGRTEAQTRFGVSTPVTSFQWNTLNACQIDISKKWGTEPRAAAPGTLDP